MEEAADILLAARCLCRWRCELAMPSGSFNRPTSPMSMVVRSIDEIPLGNTGWSEPDAPLRGLPDARLRTDALEALDVRPPPLGSCSASGILSPGGDVSKEKQAKAMLL